MIKCALLLDNLSLTKWQSDALKNALGLIDIVLILSCENTAIKRHWLTKSAYYMLNLISLRGNLTSRIKHDPGTVRVIKFFSNNKAGWQSIPFEIAQSIRESDVEIIIKFGMGLLKVDDYLKHLKVFSFHHGDPSQFRGRPAGFYELLQNKKSIGTVVQEISNKLDAGTVWAICYSKIHHHSYKKTARNFYANSKYLLFKALINYRNNEPIQLISNGINYKLPSNYVVLKFSLILLYRKICRIVYGSFYEKKWNIAQFRSYDFLSDKKLYVFDGRIANIEPSYIFYADPFFSADGKTIRVEALNPQNGMGEIVEITADQMEFDRVLLKGGHFSYPISLQDSDDEYLMPEVASHSSPYLLVDPFDNDKKIVLKGLENIKLLDATLFKHEGTYYIFGGLIKNALDCLQLFHSQSLAGPFLPHPLNPVVIDPTKARMAGRVVYHNGNLIRFGQDNSFSYGNGISICKITELSPTKYDEKKISSLCFGDSCGPHTVDIYDDSMILDYYLNRFSLLAWYRRLIPIIKNKLLQRTY